MWRCRASPRPRSSGRSFTSWQASSSSSGSSLVWHGARMSSIEDRIAVIGFAGRFPGAKTVQALFSLLEGGRQGIRFFSDDELRRAGVPEALIHDPRYVKARGALDDIEHFDA